MFAGIYFAGAAFAGMVGLGGTAPPIGPIDTGVGITIGGVDVTARVRVQGVTVRDILNDAPNTASLVVEGDGPAVGQSVRITLDAGAFLLFAGQVQTVDQAFEARPDHVAWAVTAIDDTARANARRPFGTWVATSATTIAQAITATFAPAFSAGGIAGGLPPVSIVFDGADPFIACLARLASAIGGYCKVEDRTVYLFQVDPTAPPDPIDADHRFLHTPAIQANVDSSQLRTRVYGKGYGENIRADLAAGETLVPIQDGVMFPPLGGTAIAGLTADGAQSEKLAFTGVVLAAGGTLVGPGAGPTVAPSLALQAGSGVTSGIHTVSIAQVTALGSSLAGPAATIEVGVLAPPAAAPLASPAVNGTGPDQGSHDYVVSFVTSYGETVPGAISNAITTSAASGQLNPPLPPYPGTPLVGAGVPAGTFDYKLTFTNGNGETSASINPSGQVVAGPSSSAGGPGVMRVHNGANNPFPGGQMEAGFYYYWLTCVTATGESLPTGSTTANISAPNNAADVPIAYQTDPRVTAIKIYRQKDGDPVFGWSSGNAHFVAQISAPGSGNDSTRYRDNTSQASIAAAATPPTVDTTPQHQGQIPITAIATGPAGTTGRKLYRRWYQTDPANWYLVATFNNNTATTHTDTAAHNSGAVTAPTSNTTGTAIQKIPLSNIPIGPPGVTARKLYRRFNGAGTFKLVTTLANNTATTFQDTIANSALGAAALGTATAVGNQILVYVATGAAAVTSRDIYMSPVGSAVRRRAGSILDNVQTAFVITMGDPALASQPTEPSADLSGLQQPQGQINPGATVLPVAASAPFRAAGGWVVLGGGQVVRYAAIAGQTLTGIPAAGSGAITTTVLYGQQAIPAPMLVGVTGLTRPMLKGSAVHIWIQRDDLQAQAEHASRTGGDGIVEFLIVDDRRGVDSLAARCVADLALFSRPIVTVSYATRDIKTKSGKPIAINLASPAIVATLTIQDVTITEIDLAPDLPPRFTVKASSVRFSLEDTLRRLIAGGQIVGGST